MDDSSAIRWSMQFDFDYSILPHSNEMLENKSTIVFAMHSSNFSPFILSVLSEETTMIHLSW